MKYIFVCLFLFATQAHAWVMNVDFESGQAGSKAQGPGALTKAFANTFYTTEKLHGGALAAVVSIEKGRFGFGEWGGQINFPVVLKDGDEVWFRAWIYYPVGFNFKNNGVGVKTLRIHTKAANGGNDGYFDMLTNGSSGVTVLSEVKGPAFYNINPRSKWSNIGSPVTTGQWHAFEQYVKFSPVSGKGIYRAWLNGKLVFEDTQTATLKGAGSKADFVYLWSYFNGGSPQLQKAYVDDIVITNEVPGSTDSQGNKFIGSGNVSLVSPPKPPIISP